MLNGGSFNYLHRNKTQAFQLSGEQLEENLGGVTHVSINYDVSEIQWFLEECLEK